MRLRVGGICIPGIIVAIIFLVLVFGFLLFNLPFLLSMISKDLLKKYWPKPF